MSDNKVTLDQLDNSAVEAMSSSVGDVNMLNTENKTIVGAITEIVGKKEIANAIGEPLAETDKFTEMSSEINGLLNTFKTNMMNAGVVVESGDKFKALIDKIKGLTEGEGNKGIQFANGTLNDVQFSIKHNDTANSAVIEYNLDFTPSIIFIICSGTVMKNSPSYATLDNIVLSNMYTAGLSSTYSAGHADYTVDIIDITQTQCTIMPAIVHTNDTDAKLNLTISEWYAIGLGEEDTTLRDSLASILEEKGVDVTEEDDMASLIGKVDGLLDTKSSNIDMISATELPLTGTDGQVCIITDEPKERLIAYSKYSDDIPLNSDISLFTSAMSNNILCTYNSDKLQLQFQLSCAIQNNKSLPIYYYQNGWKNFVLSPVYALTNGVYTEEAFTGHLVGCEYFNSYYKFSTGSDYPKFVSFDRLVNFDNYSTVSVTITHSTSYATYVLVAAFDSPQDGTTVGMDSATYITDIEYLNNDDNTYTFDISTWSGYYYLTIGAGYDDETFYISNVILR